MKDKVIKNLSNYRGYYIFVIAVLFDFITSNDICNIISIIVGFLGFCIVMFDARSIETTYTIHAVVNEETNKVFQDIAKESGFQITHSN